MNVLTVGCACIRMRHIIGTQQSAHWGARQNEMDDVFGQVVLAIGSEDFLPLDAIMVAGGLGVSLLPRLAIDAGVTSGADVELRAFETPLIGRRIGIAWRTGSPRANEARMIGEIVRNAL